MSRSARSLLLHQVFPPAAAFPKAVHNVFRRSFLIGEGGNAPRVSLMPPKSPPPNVNDNKPAPVTPPWRKADKEKDTAQTASPSTMAYQALTSIASELSLPYRAVVPKKRPIDVFSKAAMQAHNRAQVQVTPSPFRNTKNTNNKEDTKEDIKEKNSNMQKEIDRLWASVCHEENGRTNHGQSSGGGASSAASSGFP